MKELRIDISQQRSKSVDEFAGQSFDYVLTVCDNAKETCPIYPGHAIASIEISRTRPRLKALTTSGVLFFVVFGTRSGIIFDAFPTKLRQRASPVGCD